MYIAVLRCVGVFTFSIVLSACQYSSSGRVSNSDIPANNDRPNNNRLNNEQRDSSEETMLNRPLSSQFSSRCVLDDGTNSLSPVAAGNHYQEILVSASGFDISFQVFEPNEIQCGELANGAQFQLIRQSPIANQSSNAIAKFI